ncbi:MAG: tetratricopeptide repeat protein [Gammaproteobacteria bacterium]|nr:tetratricopeptide repeat protein [Gammaproteobacteria bacterium]
MKPHAFVAMPFGTKPDHDDKPVDFNRVYAELIKPALEAAGLFAFRADEETRAGDIRVDMFQELLIADLVVVDLTIDNPNVWYELGVRHALRARGVVLISGGQATKAFDIYTDRKLSYGLRDGGPDPDTLADDRERLSEMITQTMQSWHGRKISPVYKLIPDLVEPQWRKLRIGGLREFWDAYDDWETRIAHARRRGRVGDMLVLADEAPMSAFRAGAWIRAGKALRRIGHFRFALEQLNKGLEIEPTDSDGLREKGMCLQRLALSGDPAFPLDMARTHYLAMLQQDDSDAETWALLGRVEKDAWVASWRQPQAAPAQMVDEARFEKARLREAIGCYEKAFRCDPKHHYSGVNALALMHLYRHLTGDDRYDETVATMAGAVRFATTCEDDSEALFWARASAGDLEVLAGTVASTEDAYQEAVAINRDNWFALDSCRVQLQLLRDLDFAVDRVDAGIAVFDRAINRLPLPGREWEPRRVFLFSGHMVDAPERETPRFPDDHVDAAGARIAELLGELDAGPDDLALTQGACGGDLLFSEACLARGVRLTWLQPFLEPDFILRSVVRCGEHWRQRYLDARQRLEQPILAAPQALGEPPAFAEAGYAYERCNLWLLYTALAWGVDKVHFVCLWNGGGGDGPGGTAHMYDEVAKRTGQVHWVDTRTL